MQHLNINHILKIDQTPLYIFDIDVLYQRIQYLKNHLPQRVSLCYAMKANPFLVKELENHVNKLEVCSPGEYYICEENNIHVDKLVISGVYKSSQDIEHMILKGVKTFTIESLTQFELLCEQCQKHHHTIDVLLRLTSGNQFGMCQKEVIQIIHNRKQYPYLHILGIQYFSGTQKTSVKKLYKECQKLDELISYLSQVENYNVEELEFGGGFPVSYFEDGKIFDEETYLNEFSKCLNEMNYQGKIILELGRSIVASCGSYLTSVVDMKVNHNGNYAILDGGMHHMAYYGQMMAMKHPLYHLYPERENNDPQTWNLCGALCTINDLIVKQLPITNLKVGDVFVFENTGAYSMCEGISLFLSRDLPAVYFYKDNTYTKVRHHIPTYPINSIERRR